MFLRRWLVLIFFFGLQGCGPITTKRPDGLVERHYLGYVKIIVPDSTSATSRVSASDIMAIGLRIENGVGFGYFNDREIVTPLDCRLVFLVRDSMQLNKTTQFLQTTMKGKDICAAIY